MKTKISMACQKSIEWQPCDLRNTNEKYSMYYAQGTSRGYMYVAQISAGQYWWIIKYCCRSCPQVYVGRPALYKANISKVNVYSLLSCPYLHCRALALANGDRLLLPLGNQEIFIFVLYLYVGHPEFMGSDNFCFLELTFFLIAQSISVSKFSVIQNLFPNELRVLK